MKHSQLKQWRGKLGLSQQAAADSLGISLRMYQYYESGEWEIPVYIELACEALSARSE